MKNKIEQIYNSILIWISKQSLVLFVLLGIVVTSYIYESDYAFNQFKCIDYGCIAIFVNYIISKYLLKAKQSFTSYFTLPNDNGVWIRKKINLTNIGNFLWIKIISISLSIFSILVIHITEYKLIKFDYNYISFTILVLTGILTLNSVIYGNKFIK